MLYPFLTVHSEELEIVYSDLRINKNGDKYTQIFFERPNKYHLTDEAFDSMDCIIPGGSLQNIVGFTSTEVKKYQKFLTDFSSMLLECSQEEDPTERVR